jgi:hypothetical protein
MKTLVDILDEVKALATVAEDDFAIAHEMIVSDIEALIAALDESDGVGNEEQSSTDEAVG